MICARESLSVAIDPARGGMHVALGDLAIEAAARLEVRGGAIVQTRTQVSTSTVRSTFVVGGDR